MVLKVTIYWSLKIVIPKQNWPNASQQCRRTGIFLSQGRVLPQVAWGQMSRKSVIGKDLGEQGLVLPLPQEELSDSCCL